MRCSRSSFPAVHSRLMREVHGGLSLLYRWQGADPRREPILLMSHLDVVPVEAGTEVRWLHPPFSGAVADGFIWGRGALDIKSGALGLLEAVERLLADGFQPACDVYLSLGHDEEKGGHEGNQRIAEILRHRGIKFRFVLDEGGGADTRNHRRDQQAGRAGRDRRERICDDQPENTRTKRPLLDASQPDNRGAGCLGRPSIAVKPLSGPARWRVGSDAGLSRSRDALARTRRTRQSLAHAGSHRPSARSEARAERLDPHHHGPDDCPGR